MTLLSYTWNFVALLKQPEDWNKVQTSFNEIKAVVNALDDANFAASSGVYAPFRSVLEVAAFFVDVTNTPHYFVDRGGAVEAVASGSASIAPAQGLYVAAADYAISGRTAKYRLRVSLEANATAAGINFAFGLYPVSSVAGGADQIVYTLGSVVAGSTVNINTPAASTVTVAGPSVFNLPADGLYVLGMLPSGTQANNSAISARLALQQHWE